MLEGWTPDQIASYQKYWDAYFSGESGRRRRAKFVPGAAAHSFVQTKEPELKSAFDDWLERLVCFAFSISPQALVLQMNRATAEVQKTLAEEEGLAPLLAWVKALIDDVIATELDGADIEFCWTPTETIDPAQQETILSSYTSRGILTLNEARAALGREPLAEPAADRPMALTGAGYVGLEQTAGTPVAKRAMSFDPLDKVGEWDEDKHPRWPTGAAGGRGGRFAPTGSGAMSDARRPAPPNISGNRQKMAIVIPICTRGTHSETLVDGVMHYMAEYECLDGRVMRREAIGQRLPNFIEQP